ncbi:MAG: AAA family ATPase, partial [Ktedonobacteraceae bacterium]
MTTIELDERIYRELNALQKKLEDAEQQPSLQQLEQYYYTFRSRFGPERLANLDGEALLETMHDFSNRNSLVYWLEFKNDDELPAIFGSIAGGSSFKYGIFRRKENGIWFTGTPKKPIELSVEQAIEVSRNHRDQLIRGVEVLAEMPIGGNDKDYGHLQQDMDHAAPDVSKLVWGRKYFSLLFPDKLDDFHNPTYERFHLIKLLQLPPETDGRYVMSGRFLAIARQLDMPICHLGTLLNARDGGTPYRYWRIATTNELNTPGDHWHFMKEGNYCAIRWPEIGDLSNITNDEVGRQFIRQHVLTCYPDMHPSLVTKTVKQISAFLWDINIGDIIVATIGKTATLGIGKVTGGYTFEAPPSDSFPHRRTVEWLSLEKWDYPVSEGDLTAIKLTNDSNLLEIEKRILHTPHPGSLIDAVSISTLVPPSQPLAALTGLPARIQGVLERKGQVILYGPPGTGKTYWAENTVCELAARASFKKTFDQLADDERAVVLGDGDQRANARVRVCTFHPAYGYEDFLEGWRPQPGNDGMQFVLRSGIFKELCDSAQRTPQEKFFLIIDEINRGDIPRIFGELLTVLEKDKRNKFILLPLSREPFSVPPNVFIIGTMNTADRSIALLDAALRRRFGFIELLPDVNTLGNTLVGGIPLGPWLDALNRRICQHVGQNARNLQVGHAYFLERGQPVSDFAIFARILQEDILPLLEEYCYEDYTKLERILGTGLVNGKQQLLRHDLFELAQQAT